MRVRSHLGKVLLVLASVLATLAGADLVLLAWHGPVRAVEDFYEPDPSFGYRMRPGLEFVFASPFHGYHASVRTNSRGLRDDEVAVPKPPGVFRLLLLGDSMTAGLEVDRAQSFEAVCEARLRVHGPVEVVNAGVRGYNLDNVVGFLEKEGLSYQPDVVLYLFTDNDLATGEAYAPAGSDVSRGFTLRGALGRLAAYSHITYRVELLRQMRALRRQRDQSGAAQTKAVLPGGLVAFFTNQNFEGVPQYRLTAQRIERLADLCAANGAEFVLGGAPQQEEIDPEMQAWWATYPKLGVERLDFDGARRYLDWVAGALGVGRLDPIPAFRARLPEAETFWFHKDGHLNARGHRLLGNLLADQVEKLPAFQRWQGAHPAR